MNIETPLISVIVPIYRIERYIGECIESIIHQTYKNIEIILVDDGSDDRCPEICDLYSRKDSRVKVIHKNNGGLVSARKAGLKAATGSYIGYVDGDDYIKPSFYESLVNQIGNADVICAGFTRKLFGKLAKITNSLPNGVYELEQVKDKLISNGLFYVPGITTYLWNKLFKKTVLESFQYAVPNEITIGEDAAVTYPLLLNCKKMVVCDNTDYVYRQREDSMLKKTRPFRDEIKGIHILYNYLIDDFEQETKVLGQINDYILSTCIMRSGGVTIDNKVLFPFSQNFQNNRIVVVNAGTFGQQFVNRINEYNYCKIVSWIDDDYWEYRRCGLNVDPIELIKEEYDYVVIANVNYEIAQSLKQRLIDLGYNKDSIVMVDVQSETRNDLLSAYFNEENM